MVTRILGICSGVLLSLIVSVIVFPRSATRVSRQFAYVCHRTFHVHSRPGTSVISASRLARKH